MPLPDAPRVKVLSAVVLLLTAISVSLLVFRHDKSSALIPLRSAAQNLFDTTADRGIAAQTLVDLAVPLLDCPGFIGSAARLYCIGAAPLTGFDASKVSVPPAEELFVIETVDLLSIARLMYHTRRFGPADQLAAIVLQRQENRVEALRLAIEVRMDLGRDVDVLRHADEWIKLEPQNPRPHRVQAMVHRNHGRWDHFIISAEKAVELTTPVDWVLQIELIDGYTHLGRTSDARRELDRLARFRPELLQMAPVTHSRLLLQEGNYRESEIIIRRYLSETPDDTEALLMLGKLQLAQGDLESGIQTFERAKRSDPADEQAYYQLGQACARAGQREPAAQYLSLHRKLLDAKIRLYGMEQQAAREPFDAQIRFQLAQSYREIGLKELADFWDRAARGVTAAQ